MEVGGERGHVVAVVRQRDAAERGHGARELGLGEEAEEAEHGEAAVVDLDEAAALLLLGGGVLREADRVPARKSKVSLGQSVDGVASMACRAGLVYAQTRTRGRAAPGAGS